MKPMLAATILLAISAHLSLAQQTVTFTIDPNLNTHPISRFIYGVNQPIGGAWSNLTLIRFGGNRTTAYNWVTNASNAGSDYHYTNDNFLGGGSTPGGAVIPTLTNARDNNAGALITIPINGLVSADENGPVDIHDPARFTTRFKPESPQKESPFSLAPSPEAPIIYQDEFAHWVMARCLYTQTDPNRPIFFDLDNEPDIWSETHPEVHPKPLTYAEILQKTIAYATAIKRVAPAALIYGPVNYGWGGMVTLQNAPDANGRNFEAFYLSELAKAGALAGKRLVDVLDFHFYPEARGGNVRITEQNHAPAVSAAREQAPRSLWDPTYVEKSWITDSLGHQAINLIPRMQKIIDANYPGTKMSISEYNYGAGADISGAIAQADVLGIYGRFGLFSANEWPSGGDEHFIAAAFAMYRNFDGHGDTFGDTSISAATDDMPETSIYASTDIAHPGRIILVAINKADHPITANFDLKSRFSRGEIFRLTSENATPTLVDKITHQDHGPFPLTLPPQSVSTLRLVQ